MLALQQKVIDAFALAVGVKFIELTVSETETLIVVVSKAVTGAETVPGEITNVNPASVDLGGASGEDKALGAESV